MIASGIEVTIDQATTDDAAPGAPAFPSPHATLTAVYPREFDWRLDLAETPHEVGRGAAGEGRLDHSTVSRRHLAVSWDVRARCHIVRELGSRNGARVDGVRLGDRPAELQEQSVIQIGDVFLVYERGSRRAVERDGALPGRAAAMAALREKVAAAACDPSPVLITGETGSGKEWISRALHAASGRTGPLVAVNCAALGRDLLESQLFGHVRGAFTGATSDQPGLFRSAHEGTLFLDELGELPLELQPKLLRALQEREVLAVGATRAIPIDVRVCAATNRDLMAAVERDLFRRDLYARLAMWEIAAPPLRRRRVDLLFWLDHLHRRWCDERGRPAPAIQLAPAVVQDLLLHAWPDNLRGLERLVHACSVRGDRLLTRADLPEWLTNANPASEAPELPRTATPRPAAPSREEFEHAYAELGGNVRALARRFGRDRRQIYRWIEAYQFER
ncbi:MAG: sigma 54-interacting transcriptional regulator [Kofleriaceae bacterium]